MANTAAIFFTELALDYDRVLVIQLKSLKTAT